MTAALEIERRTCVFVLLNVLFHMSSFFTQTLHRFLGYGYESRKDVLSLESSYNYCHGEQMMNMCTCALLHPFFHEPILNSNANSTWFRTIYHGFFIFVSNRLVVAELCHGGVGAEGHARAKKSK